jgi:hypothetical protein
MFLIEHIIEWFVVRPPPLVRNKFRRNLHGQIRATLVVVSPSRNIAANLVAAYLIKLPRNFRQCVTLQAKFTGRIGRSGFCLLMLPQRAKWFFAFILPFYWTRLNSLSLNDRPSVFAMFSLFELDTHKKATLSDIYLVHQQGVQGAAEHVNHPERIAWESMCATDEGREKGKKWCKRAIWGNTLPTIKHIWKSVTKLTSGAFVAMWHQRVDHFYARYSEANAEKKDR